MQSLTAQSTADLKRDYSAIAKAAYKSATNPMQGNNCGHDKNNFLIYDVKTGMVNFQKQVVALALSLVTSRKLLRSLRHITSKGMFRVVNKDGTYKQVRSERWEVIALYIAFFGEHMDVATYKMVYAPHGRLLEYPSRKWIANKIGVSEDRIRRVEEQLKAAGYLIIDQRYDHEKKENLNGVRRLTLKFFGELGAQDTVRVNCVKYARLCAGDRKPHERKAGYKSPTAPTRKWNKKKAEVIRIESFKPEPTNKGRSAKAAAEFHAQREKLTDN